MPPSKPRRFRPLILVVDECPQARSSLRFYLRNEGYDVAEAACGQAAFENAKVNSPDLVLIDFNMPGRSGVLATQRLRSLEKMYSVPVVACAGPDSQAYRDAARAACCDAYLTKPINPAVLIRVVKSLLERRSLGIVTITDAVQLVNAMP
jgi:CheY-like chemotaxis protein